MEKIQRDSATLDGDPLRLIYTQEGEGKGQYSSVLYLRVGGDYLECHFETGQGKDARAVYEGLQHAHTLIRVHQQQEEFHVKEEGVLEGQAEEVQG